MAICRYLQGPGLVFNFRSFEAPKREVLIAFHPADYVKLAAELEFLVKEACFSAKHFLNLGEPLKKTFPIALPFFGQRLGEKKIGGLFAIFVNGCAAYRRSCYYVREFLLKFVAT